jgi:hypothetical protein
MSDTRRKHFVTFYSPGTFIAEDTTLEAPSWDVKWAAEKAREICARHAAKPYGFQFTTRSRGPEDLDSEVSATSPLYYLGGKVETLAEVKARATPDDSILVSNMECNGFDRIITNNNSWRWTQPLRDTDVVLDWNPN